MNPYTDEFFDVILTDLSHEAALLLDPGVTDSVAAARGRDLPGTLRGLLADVGTLSKLVPRLVAELEKGSTYVNVVLESSRIPRRAVVSLAARDYVSHGDGVVPRSWYEAVPVLEPDSRPLGWVLWLVETLSQRLVVQEQRLEGLVADSLLDRAVDSIHAAAEADALRQTEGTVRRAKAALRQARESLLRHGTRRLRPSPTRPSPMPSGRAWASLRVLAGWITNSGTSLRRSAQSAFGNPIHVADRGFLFQRWVGLKTMEALDSRGWQLEGDRIATLFLGGGMEARLGRARGSLWIEPRLLSDGAHPSGLRATQKEASPDIVLIVPGPKGHDAFVLDPTLRSRPEDLRTKERYLQTVEFVAHAHVAGIPVRRPPLRSWAVAPLPQAACELFTSNGATGVIPAWPPAFNPAPLNAWLADVEAHAVAWA